MKRTIGAFSMVLWCAVTARAQQLRGVVRDSATQTPLSGVVVTLMNASGGTLARAISNERGAYVVGPTAGTQTVSALRIGFRPQRVPFVAGSSLDLTMAQIPPLLEPVTVRAGANCPARPDRLQALSLLQQARAGLLATVTARQTNKATFMRLRFVRDYDDRGEEIVSQHVAVDSTGGRRESFGAVRSGAEFVANGFVDSKTLNGVRVHYGPDAETLLDDNFAAGYCFQIAQRETTRPNEIGLAFKPASRKNDRVDIEGTLWMDTVAKSLRDVQFQYVGDDHPFGTLPTGGHIEFRTMGNGIVIIDRWVLRLLATRVDPVSPREKEVHVNYTQEIGGEIATATWDDGFTWQASLGTLRALAMDYRNFIARDIIVRLKNTDYIGSPDERGLLELSHLLPGSYVAVVSDSATQRLGILMPTSLAFKAERDSTTQRSFSIPRHEDFILRSCLPGLSDSTESEPMRIDVMDEFGKRLAGAVVDITYANGPANQSVTESLDTDDMGTTRSCLRYRTGAPFDVKVTYGGQPPFIGHYSHGAKAITIRLYSRKR